MLQVAQLQAGYGASKVLFGVDLDIAPRQVVSLIGRNGMGKTTTVKTLMGMLPAQGGQVLLDGQPITGLAPHRIARLGIGLVPEGRRVFGSLSVEENLVATARQARPGWHIDRVFELFPRLKERRGQSARTLSGGEQQMLAVGRALLINPRLLILDEATEGLAPLIVAEIWKIIRQIRATGMSTLIVDRNYRAVLAHTDRCLVMEKGLIVRDGDSAALAAAPEQLTRYLGV